MTTAAARPASSAQQTVHFVFVDVFADRPLTGNPLAVVPDAEGLTIAQMRAIAREFNQSETTFVLRPTRPEAHWRLRSFTPAGAEVGGAGHNALGAWLWLAYSGQVGGGGYRQEIGEAVLGVDVRFREDGTAQVTMEQSVPAFGPVIDVTDGTGETLAAALGLPTTDFDQTLATRVVSTGAAHLLVPLRERAAVDRVSADPRALRAVLRTAGGEGCYIYTTAGGNGDADEADAYARFFNPTVGIVEDPATGTAAGPLAATLVRASRVADGSAVIIRQGHVLGRPSRLQVDVSGPSVCLSGSGLVVGEGRLAT